MKKFKCLILLLLVSLLMVTGCGKKKENNQNNQDGNSTTTTTTTAVKREDGNKTVDEYGVVNDINNVSIKNNYELICEGSNEYYDKEQLEGLSNNKVYAGGMTEKLDYILRFYNDGKCRYATKYTYVYDNIADFNNRVESIGNAKVESQEILNRHVIDKEKLTVIDYIGTEYGTGDGSELYCYDWKFNSDEELRNLINSEINKRVNQKCTLYRK